MEILNKQISLKEIIQLFNTEEKKDISLREAIRLFLQDKKIHNRSGTYKYYQNNLNTIRDYLECKQIYTVRSINQAVINDFVYYSKARNNKNVSINKRVKIIISLINYVTDLGLVTPFELKWKRLPEEESKIDIVNFDDMKKVINYLPQLSLKSHAIVLLLFTTGIRTNELCHLETANIDFKELQIYVSYTKTGVPRYTPILDEVAELLKELIVTNGNSKWLFPHDSNKDKHINPPGVKTLLRKIKNALNIQVLSAHKLRHLYATTLLQQGTDVKSVSKLLGHKTIHMTMRYLDITNKELSQKNRMNNPLNFTNYKKC